MAKTKNKQFAELFHNLVDDYEKETFKEIKSLQATAGSHIRQALTEGFFAEYKAELLIEYQSGLNKSNEYEGWRRLWNELIIILRTKRGLSICQGNFFENCRLVAGEFKLKKRPHDVLEKQVRALIKTGMTSPTKIANTINKMDEGTFAPTSRESVKGTKAYIEFRKKFRKK